MRRRVARVARRGLFVLGVALLVWMPLSCFVTLEASARNVALDVEYLTLGIEYIRGEAPPWVPWEPGIRARKNWWRARPSGVLVPGSWRVETHAFFVQTIRLPLWGVVAMCLTWPVTSFILARRKHKRGFPVSRSRPASRPRKVAQDPFAHARPASGRKWHQGDWHPKFMRA